MIKLATFSFSVREGWQRGKHDIKCEDRKRYSNERAVVREQTAKNEPTVDVQIYGA